MERERVDREREWEKKQEEAKKKNGTLLVSTCISIYSMTSFSITFHYLSI